MQYWLIEPAVLEEMRVAKSGGYKPTDDEVAAFNEAAMTSGLDISAVVDGVATIKIGGVLTNQPSFFARAFGGGNTTYSDIIDAVSLADSDERVKTIRLNISSPGGQVSGMFDAMDVIAATEKPVEAFVDGVAASAAYGLASQADKIIAKNDTAVIGSIGVLVDKFVSDDKVTISSTNAPNKAPDVTTEQGQAIVRAELDEIASIFAERIASGRTNATQNDLTITTDDVNSDFGRGGVFLAGTALKAGMIDAIVEKPALSIVGKANRNQTASNSTTVKEAIIMDLVTLKAEHNDLYNQVVALGVEQGAAKERSRVSAHLKLGKQSGSMDFAAQCISDGKSVMDEEVHAEYLTASLNRSDINQRIDDNGGDIDLPPKTDDVAASADADFVAELQKASGVDLGGVQ